EEGADRLANLVRADSVLHLCPCAALDLLTERMRRHLEELGPARWVRGEWQGASGCSGPLSSPAAGEMLRAVVALVGLERATIQTRVAGRSSDFASILLDFEDGQVAELGLWTGGAVRASGRLAATTPGGEVRAELPGRIERCDEEGRRSETVAAGRGRM